jgi:ParB family chromosome partitioning protein
MAKTAPVPGITTASGATSVVRTLIPTTTIVPDEANRRVIEDDDFEALCDSIRVLGVLQPVQVWRRPDGTHRLIDGERRWRAARKVGLAEIACDVWPGETDPRRVALAGLVLNEHRRAHGCLHVARRLRDIKNENGLSHAEVATQTGLPLDRVKTYFSLFGGSEDIHKFLEHQEVPLKVAAELVRFEKATNEARARRLLARYKESPLTVQEIVSLRRRDAREREDADEQTGKHRQPSSRLVARLETQLRQDPGAISQLEELAQRLGYRLVPLAGDARDGASR